MWFKESKLSTLGDDTSPISTRQRSRFEVKADPIVEDRQTLVFYTIDAVPDPDALAGGAGAAEPQGYLVGSGGNSVYASGSYTVHQFTSTGSQTLTLTEQSP